MATLFKVDTWEFIKELVKSTWFALWYFFIKPFWWLFLIIILVGVLKRWLPDIINKLKSKVK
ncbi:MAG: hypothetical protein IB617_02170 [Candidatus Nealsonbacteria bacterium]|nr:MAG: hypothetical protein IB617_02170 [Candidatus Nealsonbacteria bacterium]